MVKKGDRLFFSCSPSRNAGGWWCLTDQPRSTLKCFSGITAAISTTRNRPRVRSLLWQLREPGVCSGPCINGGFNFIHSLRHKFPGSALRFRYPKCYLSCGSQIWYFLPGRSMRMAGWSEDISGTFNISFIGRSPRWSVVSFFWNVQFLWIFTLKEALLV